MPGGKPQKFLSRELTVREDNTRRPECRSQTLQGVMELEPVETSWQVIAVILVNGIMDVTGQLHRGATQKGGETLG